MKVGVLGSGDVAKVLAAGFAKYGHDVAMGSRDPGKLRDWGSQNPQVHLSSFSDCAQHGELLVLAVKGTAASEALKLAGAAHLEGKVLIDATNPIADVPPENGVFRFFTGPADSLMERLQRDFPSVRFVKAFNSVGSSRMVNPAYKEGRPTMFICGADPKAKATVKDILDQFGWESADMGGVEAARAIEPLCILWTISGFLHNEWTHAFKVLHA